MRLRAIVLAVAACWAWGLGAPRLAWADPRAEARRHFQNGMALIRQGQYDEGIAELKEAYAIKPHANVLYNIARANQQAGRTADAVEYYRRYLATHPEDGSSVLQTLARLEPILAREQAAAAAAAAEHAASSPSSAPPVGPSLRPDSKAPNDPRLDKLMERLESALAKLEQAQPQKTTAPAVTAPRPAEPQTPEAVAPSSDATADEPDAAPYEERVVTASRRAQSTLVAPNATTVISGEEIRLSGLTSIVSVLRRVPGAEVMEMGVGSGNFSLRGFNQRVANKVLVLVDGRPEYQDFTGVILWRGFPIGVEDIERIEIIRGPGSALYGANAMLGVVNIITKAPGSMPRSELAARAGTGAFAAGYLASSGTDSSGDLRYRASAGYDQEYKWSRDFADNRPDIGPAVPETSMGFRGVRGQLTSRYVPNRHVSAGVSGGVHRLFTELYGIGLLRNFFFDGVVGNAAADGQAGPFRLKLFWNHLAGRVGPQYSAIGLPSQVTFVEQNAFDAELVYDVELDFLGLHHLTLGGSTRFKRADWDWLGPTLHSQAHAAAFIQDEWTPVSSFTLSASYRADRHPLLDNGQPGFAHSPRVSAVWMPFEGHSFRASAGTAFREPTFLESYVDVRIPVPGVNGASALTIGNRALDAERILAFELGYQGDLPRLGINWELAVYQNHLWDLIALSPVTPLAPTQSYDPVSGTYLLGSSTFFNDTAPYIARGVEVGTRLSPFDGLSLQGSLALERITTDASGACAPCSQAPGYKIFASATYRTPMQLEIAFEGTYVGATTWIEREPNPADPTQVVSVENPLPAYGFVNARLGYRFWGGRAAAAIVGTHIGAAHSQHPFGNRLETRLLGTLTVTP